MAFACLPFLLVLLAAGGSCSLLLRCQISSGPQHWDQHKSCQWQPSLVLSALAVSAGPLCWRWAGGKPRPHISWGPLTASLPQGTTCQSVEPEAAHGLLLLCQSHRLWALPPFHAAFLPCGSEDVWRRKHCEESAWLWNSFFSQQFNTPFQLSHWDEPATPP